MTTPIGLRHAKSQQLAHGWFVPGAGASEWLPEVLGFGFAWQEVRLLPLAHPVTRTHFGVVVMPPPNAQPHRVLRARPYQLRADCVWLPVDAELWPPATDAELQELAAGRLFVAHPATGMVGFLPEDVCGLEELLVAPVLSADAWDRARPGVIAVGGIVDVLSDAPPDLGELFLAERDQIARERPDKLPPLPGEPKSRARRFKPGLRGLVARGIFSMTRNVSRTADNPTWIDRLEGWAKRFERPEARLNQSQRDREVERLLKLLQDDPSKGLRYALPMGGDDSRGIAPPSNQLGERLAEFDLSQLGGGGAADTWDLSYEVQARLLSAYRELAQSEITAMRHRRAAYIYAHLLGDLRGAAMTLERGGFHREAAVLYRERLDDAAAASRCLVKGGYLSEAAELEEQLENWQRAGDLRLILGQEQRAGELYEGAWRQCLERRDWVEAAMLRAERMRDVDGALAMLQQEANNGDGGAFAAWLALADRAHQRPAVLRAIREQSHPGIGVGRLARVLGGYGNRTGPGEVRDAARSRVRLLIAEHLCDASQETRRDLLGAMRQCSPDDRVLLHDVRAALNSLKAAAPPSAEQARTPPSGPVRLVRGEMRLTGSLRDWQSAATDSRGVWLAAWDHQSRQVRVFCWGWSSWSLKGEPRPHGAFGDYNCQLLPSRVNATMGVVLCNYETSTRLAWLDPEDSTLPPVMDLGCSEVAIDDDGSIWALDWQPRRGRLKLCLSHATAQNERISGAVLGQFDLDKGTGPGDALITAFAGHVLMLFGKGIFIRNANGRLSHGKLPHRALSVVRSEEQSNPLILIGFAEGFCVVDISSDDVSSFRVLGLGLEKPTLGWTRHGVAVAVDSKAIWLGRVTDGRLPDSELRHYGYGKPWAILPSPEPDEVAFVMAQALVMIRLI